MSKYDNIKTATDLISEVMAHGLSTAQEDICRAQDIFGNSPIDELVRLANDIGRNNEKGEPDPKGSWGSSRRPTQSTFYMIAFSIWNWEDATRFWNTYTNPMKEQFDKAVEEKLKLTRENDSLKARRKELLEDAERGAQYMSELNNELQETRHRAEAAEAEVIQLKARLFDLLCK